jgi:AraC family transcriptional regulator, regulatory protein of adaptative response / DNA-3-methyladenine glycosylase II
MLPSDGVCQRAMAARDARFDGVFFVGITSTKVYCRPVCPSRLARPDNRRFFASAALAEIAGFRPCLRCRPELAPGRAPIGALPLLARAASDRIAAGALNDGGVAQLARELGVSERHLRRAIERELGVSPAALAQTYRLLLAKRLLADTSLSVTRIAFASGFQSVSRFNSVFRERYRLSPTALRRQRSSDWGRSTSGSRETLAASPRDLVRLTLAYRAPLAWETLTTLLRRTALPGVELVEGRRYSRAIELGGRRGVVIVENAIGVAQRADPGATHLTVDLSPSLLPVLMPLLARLRRLFDLDAEPTVVDAHLEQSGMAELIRRRPGLRVPGAFDGFDVVLGLLIGGATPTATAASARARRVLQRLGEVYRTEVPELTLLSPSAARVAEAGATRLQALGVSPRRAVILAAVARAIAAGTLTLESGADAMATRQALMEIDGIGDQLATAIVLRALRWPDAFSPSDRRLQRAARVSSVRDLQLLAEQWRPWRAYAALHLSLQNAEW